MKRKVLNPPEKKKKTGIQFNLGLFTQENLIPKFFLELEDLPANARVQALFKKALSNHLEERAIQIENQRAYEAEEVESEEFESEKVLFIFDKDQDKLIPAFPEWNEEEYLPLIIKNLKIGK